MKFSSFSSASDPIPINVEMTWPEFVSAMSEHEYDVEEKLDCPAFCPAEYKEGVRNKSASGIIQAWLAVLDCDDVTDEELAKILDSKYSYLAYTSWSHPKAQEKDLNRVRVVFPLTRPVGVTEWDRFWPRMICHLAGVSNPRDFTKSKKRKECSDIGHIYFEPYAPAGTEDQQWTLTNEGEILDTDKVLALPGPKDDDSKEVPSTEPVKFNATRAKVFIGKYRYRTKEYWREVVEAVRLVLKGEVYAEPGERDTALFKILGALVREWPNLETESVVDFFAQSHGLMEAIAPGAPDADLVRSKLERAKKERAEEIQKEEQEKLDDLILRIREAFGGTRDVPYTQEEIQALATSQDLTLDEFRRHWIYQKGGSYYVRLQNRLVGPFIKDELTKAATCYLAPAINAGVETYKLTQKGGIALKGPGELVDEYGTHVLEVKLSYVRNSGYDRSTHTYYEQACAPRIVEGLEDQEVAEWLYLFSGPLYEKLNDWLSLVPDLNQPIPALYITGSKGVGKNLFAEGIARLWTTVKATTMQSLVGDFNESLLHCPLIFADEYVPEEFRGDKGTGRLRNLITERSWSLNRKNIPRTTLEGSIRLVIAGNNDGLLSAKENLTERDIEAIVDRILHLEAGDEAADYLASLPDLGNSFRYEDRIAKHILHLHDTRVVKKDHRFGIKSEAGKLHRSLTVASGARSNVCAWLCGALMGWDQIQARPKIAGGLKVKDGYLYASTRALIEGWDSVKGVGKMPSIRNLGQAIQAISTGEDNGMKKIRTDNLVEWCRDSGYATEGEVRSWIEKAGKRV